MSKEIPISGGRVAIVDDGDYALISRFKWSSKQCGNTVYAHRGYTENGRKTMVVMHRFLMGAKSSIQVDHVNGNGLDNRRENLRFATLQQNQFNQTKIPGCSSKFKGVHWNKKFRKFQASIRVHGHRKSLGYFRNDASGAKAYDQAAIKFYGQFARTNEMMGLYV